MRKLLRGFITNALVFFILSRFTSLIHYTSLESLLSAALILTLVFYLAKPIINLLWLPINLLTLGLLSWVPTTLILLLTLILTPGFSFHPLTLPRTQLGVYVIPNIHFDSISSAIILTWAYLLLKRFIRWVTY